MTTENIDADGYRANVGIIVANDDDQLLLAGRAGSRGWQFPQGGVVPGEAPEAAMYRELNEEVGLQPSDVELLGCTANWISYRLPNRYVRRNITPLCIGQKQMWYLLRFRGNEESFRFDTTDEPEFDRWRWVNYWLPVNEVIYFKRRVYAQALYELSGLLHPDGPPAQPKWWPPRWRRAFQRDLEQAGLVGAEEVR